MMQRPFLSLHRSGVDPEQTEESGDDDLSSFYSVPQEKETSSNIKTLVRVSEVFLFDY